MAASDFGVGVGRFGAHAAHEERHDLFGGELLLALPVGDARAPAEVDVAERHARLVQSADEPQHDVARALEGFDREDLAPDVTRQSFDLKVREVRRDAPVELKRLFQGDPELVRAKPRRDVGVRVRVDVGNDAKRHRRRLPHLARDGVQSRQLRGALRIEAADAEREGDAHFLTGLPDPGEADPLRVPARAHRADHFADAHGVEARALRGEKFDDARGGVRLQGVADQVRANTIYLRPETAQGIFVNFLNVQKTGRMKLPFGIAQIGKAFRNEIVARQFIFRMREFEQMEMQFFVRPGEEMKWWQAWKETRMAWHRALGFGDDRYRFHDHEKLAHYANAATDIEYNFPFGFKEVEGIHSRTDFDLGNHQKFSGRKIQYFDPETGESYVPYVVETSIGVDRMFLQVMSAAYTEEQLEGGDSRVVLRLPAALAPVKVAVLPLVKKDGMPEVAQKIVDLLKYDYNVVYDEKDSVGKRYRRQDAVGTPFCVTVDGQTLEDNTVTVRHRDTMQQERVAIDKLPALVEEECSYRKLFRKLNL